LAATGVSLVDHLPQPTIILQNVSSTGHFFLFVYIPSNKYLYNVFIPLQGVSAS